MLYFVVAGGTRGVGLEVNATPMGTVIIQSSMDSILVSFRGTDSEVTKYTRRTCTCDGQP